jgi:hypothetical protein
MYLDHPVRDRSSVLSPHTSRAVWVWAAWVVGALLLLPVVGGAAYAVVVAGSALVLTVWYPGRARSVIVAGRDLTAIAVMYVAVVALLAAAFRGFSTDHAAGLFLCFAGALLVGTVGPVVYTVWVCRRPLADLGLRRDN